MRPSSASPPTMPPTMPPIAPPERPDEDEDEDEDEAGEGVLLGVLDADALVVTAVELVEGSKSASLIGRAVAEGLAETSDEYVLFNRSSEMFATGFVDVLQQMLIWFPVWVHASLLRTR
jgi:hypothetical protein